jgi:hypothetical protein
MGSKGVLALRVPTPFRQVWPPDPTQTEYSCWVLAVRFFAIGQHGWAVYSLLSGIGMIALFVLASTGFLQRPGFVDVAGLFERLSATTGLLWASLIAIHAARATSIPNFRVAAAGAGPRVRRRTVPGSWRHSRLSITENAVVLSAAGVWTQGARVRTALPCWRSAGTDTGSCTTTQTPSIRRRQAVQRTTGRWCDRSRTSCSRG